MSLSGSTNTPPPSALQRGFDGMARALGALMVACLALMVVLVFVNVALRYGANSGITVSEELSRWLFVWMTFLGAVVALHERAHLGTDMLVARLGRQGRLACLVLGHALMLGLCGLLLAGSWAQSKINWDTTSAVMEASMAGFYAAGVVCSALGGLVLIHDLWRLLTGQMRDEELVGIQASEDHAPQ